MKPSRFALDQSALREASHELGGAKMPGLTFVGVPHTISENAELVRSDSHDVTNFMAESHAGNVTILRRREHRAEKEDNTVRIPMMRSDHLSD